MDNLLIEKTKDTFGIECDFETGTILMEGNSYPEDAIVFFEQLFNWIEEYFKTEKPIIVNMKVDYLNTSSIKCVLDIFEILEEYNDEFKNVTINWYYKSHDFDIKEAGEEFSEDVDIDFNFIEVK